MIEERKKEEERKKKQQEEELKQWEEERRQREEERQHKEQELREKEERELKRLVWKFHSVYTLYRGSIVLTSYAYTYTVNYCKNVETIKYLLCVCAINGTNILIERTLLERITLGPVIIICQEEGIESEKSEAVAKEPEIDPVMKQYMEMVQQQKQREEEEVRERDEGEKKGWGRNRENRER